MAIRRLIGIVLSGILTTSFLPVLSQDESSTSTEQTVTINSNGGVHRWKNSTGLTSFNIESRGKIEVTDDDKDIKSLSNDGYLEITKTVFGSKRSIVIESLGGGKFKEWFDGSQKS